MAQDLKIQINQEGVFDLILGEHDFETVDGLETSVAVLLFTDARADSSEIPIPSKRRGWVGNVLRSRDLGGKLWLSSQLKNTQDLRNKVALWARESLTPLLETGLATDILVTSESSVRGMELVINIQTKEGRTKAFEFWIKTDLGNLAYVS